MPNITRATLEKRLGKRRLAKIEDIGFEWSGFDVVLADGWFYDCDQTISFFEFDDFPTQAELIESVQMFVDMSDFKGAGA